MNNDAAALEALYGTAEPPVQWRTLSAGALSVDLENGQLRYLRWQGVEVLRAISFLVRDDHWGTYAAEIDGLEVSESEGRFEVRYRGRCARGAGDFVFEARIVAEASGQLRFTVEGSPESALRTNRTGFVVLHPLDGVIGMPLEVEHTDGRTETVVLPREISPREPIKDIFALTHRPSGSLSVRVEMTGDAYDMEDQRNWTDASLKTYVRPLTKPWPYVIAAGERVEQSVTVVMAGEASAGARDAIEAALVARRSSAVFPRLGLAVETGDIAEALRQIERVRGLGVHRLIARATTPEDLAAFARLSGALKLPLTLEFAVPGVDPGAEVAAWAIAAAESGLSPDAVVAIPLRLYPLRPAGVPSGEASLADIAAALRSAFPQAEIGSGVLTGFPEFNRNRPAEGGDFVSHTTSAIVHAADDRSVIESLETLPYVLGSARAIAPGKPYRLGPSGVGLGLNPDGPPRWREAGEGRRTMVRNDPRHAALFGAAWTIGYMARTVAAVDELTLSHAVGDFGSIGKDGSLHPIYHVLRGLARGAGLVVIDLASGPPDVVGVGFATDQGDEIWLANLRPEMQVLRVGRPASVALLDLGTTVAAWRDPELLDHLRPLGEELSLGPFAIARLILG